MKRCTKVKASMTILTSLTLSGQATAQSETAELVGTAVGGIAGLILVILIGAIVGWLASLIVKGGGSGFWPDVLIGVGGSFLAGYILPALGLALGGIFGSFFAALIGAILLILIVRLIRKAAN